MSNTHNTDSPNLVNAQVEEHQHLVPVYIKQPDTSLIDSSIVKWGSKIMMGIMTLVILPVCLAAGYHAYDTLERHGQMLAVVVSNQADAKNALADINKKFDVVIGQVNDNTNRITALDTEVADMKAAPPKVIEQVPTPTPAPIWHQHHAPDSTTPFIKAIEKALEPKRHRGGGH